MIRENQRKVIIAVISIIAAAVFGLNSFFTTNEVDSWCEESNVVEGYYKGIAVETEDRMEDSTERTIISETNTMRGEFPREDGSHYKSYFAVESWDKLPEFRSVLESEDISYVGLEKVRIQDEQPTFDDILNEGNNNLSSFGINKSDIVVDSWNKAFYLRLDRNSNTTQVSKNLEGNLSEYTDWPLTIESYC